MKKISQKQINDAAKDHAKNVLGPQFKSNPDAVKVTVSDFLSGIKWYTKTLKQTS